LHRASDELQVGVVTDLEFYLVPDVGKKWPRIIVNKFIEYFFVGEFDQSTTWMIGGEILAAKLP
jgi:hypothetical protein